MLHLSCDADHHSFFFFIVYCECVSFEQMFKKIKRTYMHLYGMCPCNYNRQWNQINFWTITFFFLSLFPEFHFAHIFLWNRFTIHIAYTVRNVGLYCPISKRPITWYIHTVKKKKQEEVKSTKQWNSINLRNGQQPRRFMCIRCHLTWSDRRSPSLERHSVEWCHQENWTTN